MVNIKSVNKTYRNLYNYAMLSSYMTQSACKSLAGRITESFYSRHYLHTSVLINILLSILNKINSCKMKYFFCKRDP